MMAVDTYFNSNGRSFFSVNMEDSEFDRMARTVQRRPKRIEASDLLGRRYENFFPVYTTESAQIAEDSY